MSRIVSFVVLVTIVVLVGALSFKVMSSFLLPMFLAIVLGVVFRPLHKWFIARCQGHDRLAAGLTTASILLIVLIPTLLILSRAAAEAFSLATEVDTEVVRERLGKLRQRFHLELPAPAIRDTLADIRDNVSDLRVSQEANDPQADPGGIVKRLQTETARIHEQLSLDRPPPDHDPLAPDTREQVATAWRSLDADMAKLAAAEPGTPEFGSALDAYSAAFSALRQALLGTPMLEWLRLQVNPDEDQIRALQERVRETATPLALGTGQAVGGFLGGLLVGVGVMVISLYYFLADGPTMVRAVMRLSPLDERYEEQLLNEFATISRAVVLATLLSAFAQGLLASLGYFFTGFQNVFLLTVITMLLAMIPFVGAASVWGACSLWLLLYEERTTAAICLALYGALVVSMIDNLIKPMVLHGQSNLHPLLALLSILGGIKALGPIGIFVGPMGVAFLQALLNMLHTEIVALDDSQDDDPRPRKAVAPP